MSHIQIWLVLGLLMIGIEIMSGTFVMLLLGGACIATAICVGLDWLPTVQGQLLAMSGFSVLSLLLFQKKLREAWTKISEQSFQNDEGSTLVLSVDIAPGESREIAYQGTTWTAINSSLRELKMGERVKIVKSEGIKLIISNLS